MQTLFGTPIQYLVLLLEIFIILTLIIGWIYGSRRMDFDLHHRAVWLVVFLHIVTVGLWMIPRSMSQLSIMLANPSEFWYRIVHDIVGMVAILFGAVLVALFLIKRGMPLKLLKRSRPFMFITIGLWILAFVLGLYWFILGLPY